MDQRILVWAQPRDARLTCEFLQDGGVACTACRTWEDLEQQRDDGDRRKDEFLAMLAHELRNPLAPLRTGLHLLRLEPGPEASARTLATMDRQITNLTRLIDDLLDVSRLTRRKIALRPRPLDVRESMSQAVDTLRHAAAQKGLRLEVELPPAPVVVEADAVRLEQMVGNMLGNAIKFTPSHGAVRATVEVTDGCAVLRVTDTGIGIPAEQLAHVFDLFAQAPRTLDRSQGGLGIGLTVVKLLAELHGGEAHIFSQGAGLGTEVAVRLPLAACLAVSGPAVARRIIGSASRRVLIVEDNADVAEMLREYLEHAGHTVVVAYDGRAGLEAARRHRPDVLVCDIGLPGMDGYEVAERFRSEVDGHSCLLIAVTGYGDAADRERSQKAGFVYHLTKPADPEDVAQLVAGALDHPVG